MLAVQSDLLRQADEAEAAQEVSRAVDLLGQYLGFRPEDTATLARCAVLLDRVQSTQMVRVRALIALKEVLRRDPTRDDIRMRVARTAIGLGRFSEAREDVRALLKLNPDDQELVFYLAECEEHRARYSDAAILFERVCQLNPERIEAYARLAHLLRRPLREPTKADAVMTRLLAKNPASFRAFLAHAEYARGTGSHDVADRDVAKAAELNPTAPEVALARAEVSLRGNRSEEGQAILEEAWGRNPKDPRFPQALARIALVRGDRPLAIDLLRKTLQLAPIQPEPLWTLAGLLIDKGERAEARLILAFLRGDGFSSPLVNFLEARMQLQEGQPAQAIRQLERVQLALKSSLDLKQQVDLALAESYRRLANPDQEIAILRRAVDADANWPPSRMALGSALERSGQIDEAIEQYRKLPPTDASVRLALARAILERNRSRPPPERAWDEFDSLVKPPANTAPTPLPQLLLQARALAMRESPEKAASLLEREAAAHRKLVDYWLARIDVAELASDFAAVELVLSQADRELPANPRIQLARAQCLGRRRPEELPAQIDRLEKLMEESDAPSRILLENAAARLCLEYGQPGSAERLWRKVTKEDPNNLESWQQLFDLALAENRLSDAQVLSEQVRRIEGPNQTMGQFNRAALVLARARAGEPSNLSHASALLIEVSRDRPRWPKPLLLLGQIEDMQGEPDKALANYMQAISLGERAPALLLAVAGRLAQARRFAQAVEVFRFLELTAGLTPATARLGAEIALGAGDPDEARRRAALAVSGSANSSADQLWLGRILWNAGQRKAAEAPLRKACDLSREDAEPWISLLEYYVRGEQDDKAKALVDEARQRLSARSLPTVLAIWYDRKGNFADAEAQYESAAANNPGSAAPLLRLADFQVRRGKLDRAIDTNRKALAETKPTESEQVVLRRQLAAWLIDKGSYKGLLEALQHLDKNVTQPNPEPGDIRLKARLLAMLPGRRSEGIAVLQREVLRSPSDIDSKFLLARLYESEGDWVNARAQLQNLVDTPGGNRPEYFAYLGRGMIRMGEIEAAKRVMLELTKIAPEDISTVELRARLFVQVGLPRQAEEVLGDIVRTDPARSPAIADLLDELGLKEKAEALLRQRLVSTGATEDRVRLIQFLGRNKRGAEAVETGLPLMASMPAEAAAAILTPLVASRPLDRELCRRVDAAIEAAAKREPKNRALLFYQAFLRDCLTDYAKAEQLYRDFLADQPRNADALNNLAWLFVFLRNRDSEALELMERAIQESGPTATLLDTQGLACLASNSPARALQNFETALSQETTPIRLLHRARALTLLKKRVMAEESLQKSHTAGLKESSLHPLEAPSYRDLCKQLGVAIVP